MDYTTTERDYVMANLDSMTIGQISRAIGKSRKSLFLFLRNRRIRMDDHPALYDVAPQQFEQPIRPEVAYILGYLWADGHLNESSNSIVLDCVADDVRVIEPVFDTTGEWLKSDLNRSGKRPSRVLLTVNARIARFLISHGFGHKSVRSPDSLVALLPDSIRPLFWRGYFDGDGCIYNSTVISIAGSFNQDWTAWCQLLNSLTVHYRVVRREHGSSKSSSVTIHGQTAMLRLLDYIYFSYGRDSIGLSRKYAAYQALIAHAARRPMSNTGFIGVHRNRRRFVAKIAIGGGARKVQTYIGFFDSPEEAARAYDRRAIELRGVRARLNFPLSDYDGVSQAA